MSEPTGQGPSEPTDGLSFDGDFDAERAKALIERLRDENKTLKGSQQPQDQKDAAAIAALRRQVDELKPKADQFAALEEASKSDAQRLQEAAATAQREAETAKADAIRYKAAATHGIPADYHDLLTGSTEEEVAVKAEKISALLKAQTAITPPATRTVENLRPGATPVGAESEDDVLMAQLFGPGH